jgi:hypothetical protein
MDLAKYFAEYVEENEDNIPDWQLELAKKDLERFREERAKAFRERLDIMFILEEL